MPKSETEPRAGAKGGDQGPGGGNHGPNQKRQTQQTFLSMEQEARETDIEFPSMVKSVRAARVLIIKGR